MDEEASPDDSSSLANMQSACCAAEVPQEPPEADIIEDAMGAIATLSREEMKQYIKGLLASGCFDQMRDHLAAFLLQRQDVVPLEEQPAAAATADSEGAEIMRQAARAKVEDSMAMADKTLHAAEKACGGYVPELQEAWYKLQESDFSDTRAAAQAERLVAHVVAKYPEASDSEAVKAAARLVRDILLNRCCACLDDHKDRDGLLIKLVASYDGETDRDMLSKLLLAYSKDPVKVSCGFKSNNMVVKEHWGPRPPRNRCTSPTPKNRPYSTSPTPKKSQTGSASEAPRLSLQAALSAESASCAATEPMYVISHFQKPEKQCTGQESGEAANNWWMQQLAEQEAKGGKHPGGKGKHPGGTGKGKHPGGKGKHPGYAAGKHPGGKGKGPNTNEWLWPQSVGGQGFFSTWTSRWADQEGFLLDLSAELTSPHHETVGPEGLFPDADEEVPANNRCQAGRSQRNPPVPEWQDAANMTVFCQAHYNIYDNVMNAFAAQNSNIINAITAAASHPQAEHAPRSAGPSPSSSSEARAPESGPSAGSKTTKHCF